MPKSITPPPIRFSIHLGMVSETGGITNLPMLETGFFVTKSYSRQVLDCYLSFRRLKCLVARVQATTLNQQS